MRISAQPFLMRADIRPPDALNIVKSSPKPNRLHDRWRTGLEPMWWVVVRDPLPSDLLDHLAATLVWRQLLKEFALAVKDTDSSRAIDLVPSENVEVDVE